MRVILFLFLLVSLSFKAFGQTDGYEIYKDLTNHYYKQSIVSTDSTSIPYWFDIEKYTQLKNDVKGLDISRWQGHIKWDIVNNQINYKFIFIRSSNGLKIDPMFHHNWNQCKLKKGAYHFFNPFINGITQAKFLLSVVDIYSGDLPPVIDVEYTRSWRKCNKNTAAKNLKMMLDYIEDKTGVRPVIYTNGSFWNKYVNPYFKGNANNYPLWIAHYGVEYPRIPTAWKNWTFWQWTHEGIMDGHRVYWDKNYYNGYTLDKILIK